MWTCNIPPHSDETVYVDLQHSTTLRGNILCEPATFHHNCTTRCTTAACKIASSSSCRPTADTYHTFSGSSPHTLWTIFTRSEDRRRLQHATTATTASIKATEKETIYWSTYDTSPRRIALFQTSYKYTSIQQESREEQWINLLVTWKNKGVTHSTVSVWFKDSKGLSIL